MWSSFVAVLMMVSDAVKAECMQWLFRTDSVVQVQRLYRKRYGKHAKSPSYNSLVRWKQQFLETGSLHHCKGAGRPSRVSELEDTIRNTFEQKQQLSLRNAGLVTGVAKSTIQRVLTDKLKMKPYRPKNVQELKPNDCHLRLHYAREMISASASDEHYLTSILFTDESTFHTSSHVNRHNMRFWAQENPHVLLPHQRDSPKVNVWCGLTYNRVIGPYFFDEKTVCGETYLHMLETFVIPTLGNDKTSLIFQQDGAPPHFLKRTWDSMKKRLSTLTQRGGSHVEI